MSQACAVPCQGAVLLHEAAAYVAWCCSLPASTCTASFAAATPWVHACLFGCLVLMSCHPVQPKVQLAAKARVTLALNITGLPVAAAADTGMLSAVLAAAASQWGGDFETSFISVSFSQPEYGVPTAQFQAAASQAVVTRYQPTPVSPTANGSSSSSNGSDSNNSSGGRLLRELRVPRRLLAAQQVDTTLTVPVWVQYGRVAPTNATDVIAAVISNCEVDGPLDAGTDLSGSSCADRLSELLRGAAVPLGSDGVGLMVAQPPMVSPSAAQLGWGREGAMQAITLSSCWCIESYEQHLFVHVSLSCSQYG